MTLVDTTSPHTFQVKMTRDKTTKNTVVYRAPKGEYVDTLYIQQDAFRSHTNSVMSVFPDTIMVQITA